MLSGFLSKIGLPVLMKILGEALAVLDNPQAKTAVKAIGKVEEVMKAGEITSKKMAEAYRHAEKMEQVEMEDYRAALSEVNQSLRAEVASEDKYMRRMRPILGV